ncbi:MAG: hypothetical protein ACAI44_23850, partial [Candidatus Sericytochromatia bacterium]
MHVSNRPVTSTVPSAPPITPSPQPSTPATTTPPSAPVRPSGDQVARQQGVLQAQQLTAPTVVSTVSSRATEIAPEQLQENASQHQDLHSALVSTVPSAPAPPEIPVAPPAPPPPPSSSAPAPVANPRADAAISSRVRGSTQPEIRKLEVKLMDLGTRIQSLNTRMSALSDIINDASVRAVNGPPLSPTERAAVTAARTEVDQVETQLMQAMTAHTQTSEQLNQTRASLGVRALTAMDANFINPDQARRLTPTNVARADHVINTHIIQAATDTPAIRGLKAQVRDLTLQIGSLERRHTALTATIQELSSLASPTSEQQTALREARADLRVADHQLGKAKTKLTEVKEELGAHQADNVDASEHPKTVWERVKGTYIEDSENRSTLFMTAAIDYRRQLVDTLVREESTRLGISVDNSGGSDAAHTRTKIVGSASQTSDRDVNVTVRGSAQGTDTRLVDAVNSRFRSMFGQDSGSYFDTNLYNEGLMPDIEKIKKGQPIDPWTSPESRAVNDRNQDLISLVKQRRFFASPEEWSTHTEAMLTIMSSRGVGAEQISALRSQYAAANTFVATADTQIAERTHALQERFPQANHAELELMASNELYLENVRVADQMMSAAGGDEGKIAAAKLQMGLAHYFANEAGMSEGVLRDVVINGQEIPNGINPERARRGQPPMEPLRLSSQQLLQSFNENLGETLKEFNH